MNPVAAILPRLFTLLAAIASFQPAAAATKPPVPTHEQPSAPVTFATGTNEFVDMQLHREGRILASTSYRVNSDIYPMERVAGPATVSYSRKSKQLFADALPIGYLGTDLTTTLPSTPLRAEKATPAISSITLIRRTLRAALTGRVQTAPAAQQELFDIFAVGPITTPTITLSALRPDQQLVHHGT